MQNAKWVTRIFPLAMAVQDFIAAGVYMYYGQWRWAAYWASAGVIAVAVTI